MEVILGIIIGLGLAGLREREVETQIIYKERPLTETEVYLKKEIKSCKATIRRLTRVEK